MRKIQTNLYIVPCIGFGYLGTTTKTIRGTIKESSILFLFFKISTYYEIF